MTMGSLTMLMIMLTLPVSIITILIIRWRYRKEFTWPAMVGFAIGIMAILSLIFAGMDAISRHSQTSDVEIISGQVTKKERTHGSYQRPYECNCRKVNDTRVCSTCYEDRYTVKWTADTTVGNHTVKSLDRGSRLVYSTPDPVEYLAISVGDPAAAMNGYRNHMLGVPKEYLYNDNLGAPPELIAKIPDYPRTYNMFRINRVVVVDDVISGPLEIAINRDLAMNLRTLGPQKEVNIIVVAGPPDANLMYAVREKWNGGKKNDVILVLGIEDGDIIKTAEVLTWDKNHYFKIALQDHLIEHGKLNAASLVKVYDTIKEHYVRPEMKDYEALREYIQTPTWVAVMCFIILLIVPVVGFFVSRR